MAEDEAVICWKVVREDKGHRLSVLVAEPKEGDLTQFPPLEYFQDQITSSGSYPTPGCFAFKSLEQAEKAAVYFKSFTFLPEGEIEVWQAEGIDPVYAQKVDFNLTHPRRWVSMKGYRFGEMPRGETGDIEDIFANNYFTYLPEGTTNFRGLRLVRMIKAYPIQRL